MGYKGKWFVAVKRVFSPDPKEKKKTQKSKSRKGWFGQCSSFYDYPSEAFDTAPNRPIPLPEQEGLKLGDGENDESKHAYSVAIASAVAAKAAVVAAQAAAEVIRLTKSARFFNISKEEFAAIKIQTAFRGYQARRALRALRGLIRLKALTNSNSVKHQAVATLRCMQTLARVQSQIRSRRIRMTEENQALQKQLQLKHERELEKQRMGEEWDTSLQTKEQLEASLQHRQEAAIRRERAMAYAFSHQWKNPSRANPMFMDPNNPQWGWSWLERWMAARPWEGRSSASEKDLSIHCPSTRSDGQSVVSAEIVRAHHARRDSSLERPSSSSQKRPASRHSSLPTPPPSKIPSIATLKAKSASPKAGCGLAEGDMGCYLGTGSSVRDDGSQSSPHAVPSYMASTESAKARSRPRTLLTDQSETSSERGSASSVKKRLVFPASGVPSPTTRARRLSGPQKADVAYSTSNASIAA